MQATDQGTREQGRQRHLVVPRTLVFLTSTDPTTGAEEVLLLQGAPTKRLWANLYNGIGGHIEANEDVYAAARREVSEEAGLAVESLTLRGVIHVNAGADATGPRPGVMIFVFRGQTGERTVAAGPEGALRWIPVNRIQEYPLVDDLYAVIPQVLGGPFFYGHYSPQPDGALAYRFCSVEQLERE